MHESMLKAMKNVNHFGKALRAFAHAHASASSAPAAPVLDAPAQLRQRLVDLYAVLKLQRETDRPASAIAETEKVIAQYEAQVTASYSDALLHPAAPASARAARTPTPDADADVRRQDALNHMRVAAERRRVQGAQRAASRRVPADEADDDDD